MDSADLHRSNAPGRLGFAVLTVSDSRTPDTDTSGQAIRRLVEEAGHEVMVQAIVRDEAAAIRAAVEAMTELEAVDVLVATGGTGFTARDVTVPTVRALFEVEIPGFGELFRMLSYAQVKAAAMLSRATAGLLRGRAVFIVPGSPKAVDLAMRELILPEAAHLISHARR